MRKTTIKGLLTSFALVAATSLSAQQLQKIEEKAPSQIVKKKNKVKGTFTNLQSETLQSIQETGFARCLSVENEKILQNQNGRRFSDAQFEEWLAPHIAKIKADRAAGRAQMAVYNIPVVIHIVHDGDAVNSVGNIVGENISDEQALSQIQVMNEDYRRMMGTPGGANTTGVAIDAEINFCLAVTDEVGNPTTGIIRHNITPYSNSQTPGVTDDWEIRSDVETMKTNTQWDPTKYMNMWCIKPGGNSLNDPITPGLGGLLGYAQFPSSSGLGGLAASGGAANTDGVVAGYDSFGTIAEDDGSFILNATYNLGRTMTHEVGHWLGLRHIWGDTTSCTGGASAGDYCADTPDSTGPNYNCVSVDNCPADGLGNDQVQNYMDYTNDACMDTFTQDQKDRMQTVMSVSPRRMELATSTACVPNAPYIAFANLTSNLNEATDCSFTDYSLAVTIADAPTGDANITFNIDGGTAVNTSDYELVNNSVVFPNGSTASQNLTVRVYNDGFVEGNETVAISMSLSGSTDAQLNTSADSMTITLVDDDSAPSTMASVDVFDEDFEDLSGWTVSDADGDGTNWGSVNGLEGAVSDVVGVAGYSATSDDAFGGSSTFNPDNYLISPQFTIPAGATSASLAYFIGAYSTTGQFQEHYSVYFTTDPGTSLTEFTLENNRQIPANATTETRNHDLLPYAGMTGNLVFRHHNSAAAHGFVYLDGIDVNAVIGTAVQTVENSATQAQVSLLESGTIYSGDATTGDIMMDIVNGNNQDYGCVSAYVSRGYNAGAPAVMYQGAGVDNYVMSKTFAIQASSQQASGTGTVKFYFTEEEISAWETTTGNSRNDLVIIKDANVVSLMPGVAEVIPATIGSFGTNVTLEGNFGSGITGGYVFGKISALSISENEFEVFGVYPNPSNGEVTLTLSTNEDVTVSLFDIRGRKVYNEFKQNNSDVFTTKLNFSGMASGVYMLDVQSGSKRAVKKIVIN